MKNIQDLSELMKQISQEMDFDYYRNRRQATEDPGTAGDLAEENWASLLRNWLPPTLQVVTKGRIIGDNGKDISPQIDILVLQDVYPKKLAEKKLYVSGGVVAAFECKSTLRSSHIAKAIKTAGKVKQLSRDRTGSPYVELHSPIIYGLLTHSHSWKQSNSQPEQNVTKNLLKEDRLSVAHPKFCMDLLCVADLGMWSSQKHTYYPPLRVEELEGIYPSNVAASGYLVSAQNDRYTPIGDLIAYLSRRLAWELPSLRLLADYYHDELTGGGLIHRRFWNIDIYSKPVREQLEQGRLSPTIAGKWDKWNDIFM